MRKIIFLLVLLPHLLYSHNHTVSSKGIIKKYSYTPDFNNALALTSNTIAKGKFISPRVPENKSTNTNYSAELFNFRFECGNLRWSTASETNCSHFLILFSRDDKNWNILGQVYGAGNSTHMNNYRYPTDLKDVYFKLYQVDFDGNIRGLEPIFGSCKK
jgi:hypothetical protein